MNNIYASVYVYIKMWCSDIFIHGNASNLQSRFLFLSNTCTLNFFIHSANMKLLVYSTRSRVFYVSRYFLNFLQFNTKLNERARLCSVNLQNRWLLVALKISIGKILAFIYIRRSNTGAKKEHSQMS